MIKAHLLPKKKLNISEFNKIYSILNKHKIHTICQSAKCPNRGECFKTGEITVLLLGDTCTRNCKYCSVKKKQPEKIDMNEPQKVYSFIKELDKGFNLKYIVLTSVTRDDSPEQAAEVFYKTVDLLKKDYLVEVLIPDFNYNFKLIDKALAGNPDVAGFNLEITKNLYKNLRPQSDYKKNLELLKYLKYKNQITKTALLLGLGETMEDIIETIDDMKKNIDILIIGQYLTPSQNNIEVKKYYTLEEFEYIKEIAKKKNIRVVEAGTYYRSSYKAYEIYKKNFLNKK